MSQIFLFVRHAQTNFHQGRLAGWTPGVGLSDEGKRQAEDLARRLAGVPLTAVYSSPLQRCRETAEIACRGRKVDVRAEEGVAEVKYGSWQGKPYKTLARTELWKTIQLVPSQAVFPGGESVLDLQRRAVDAVEGMRGRHKRGIVAVFSHADTIKAVAAHYLGLHLDLFQRIVIGNASVTAFAFGRGFPRLLRLSDTGSYAEFVPPPRSRTKPAGPTAKRR